MEGIILGLIVALFLLPLGGGMLAAADSVASYRRSPELGNSSFALQLFGVLLLVIGVLPWIAFSVAVALSVFAGEDFITDFMELFVALNSVLFLSTIPLAGAMLIGISRLIRHARSADQESLLDKMLGSVKVIGWLWFIVGVVAFAFPIGLIPGAVFLIVVFVINQRRSAQQNELLWILMIAAQKNRPLAPGVEAFAQECLGTFQGGALSLAHLLKSGVPLPDALDRVPRILPESVKVAVRVGWESGSLALALREIAVSRTLRKPIWHAMAARLAYLVALLIVLQSIVGFVLYFIIPKFKKIFMDFGVELPKLTLWVLSFSDWVVEYFPFVIQPGLTLLVYGLVLKCWVAWRPQIVNQLVVRLDTARILRALAWSVTAERPLAEGLATLARWSARWNIRYRLACALEGINRGGNWSQCLVDHGLLRPAEAAVLASAERAGNLPWAMRELAEHAERNLGYRLQLCNQVLFPFVVLFFGGLVFFFVAGMFSPLVKLISELSS